MRVAVISDIHANYHAFEAVLAAIAAEGPDEIWCLGDVVGYGPEPNRCCELVADRATLCLAGNHDLAVIGSIPVDEFNGDAATAVRWTQGAIDDDAVSFLRTLESSASRDGAELFHGSPLDPVWDYVLSEQAAELSFLATSAPLVLVGHSHVPLALSWGGDRLAGGLAEAGREVDLTASRWLLNPGSVGQPRGNDPRAAWLMVDFGANRASFRRAEYPIERTQEEILARGLPKALAARLALGQ
ncbi:MAG: metallophosphatase family protein [Actinomycetota bacterium]|nr:metallophosphatase family protein [Actinomycetota bacterium]